MRGWLSTRETQAKSDGLQNRERGESERQAIFGRDQELARAARDGSHSAFHLVS
jgi:hypothetical protein